MRKPLVSWLIALVVAAAGLGLGPAVLGATAAAPSAAADDRDGDGVADGEDACPDTAGTTETFDGFAGCVRIGQYVYRDLVRDQVTGEYRVTGQVHPVSQWRGANVCFSGIVATLRAEMFTDHDPSTDGVAMTESTTSDANGYFSFTTALPFGTKYSVRLSPRAVVGGEAYCASASTAIFQHVDAVAREVTASYRNWSGRVVGRAVVVSSTPVGDPCSDLQTATVWRRFDNRPSTWIASTTFSGATETFSIDMGPLEDGADYYVEVAERGPEGFPETCRSASIGLTVVHDDADDDGVRDSADHCPQVPGPTAGEVPGCVVVERRISASYDGGRVSGELAVTSFPPGTGNPCQLAMQLQLWTVDDQDRRTLVTQGPSSGGLDVQTYSLPVDPALPEGTRYVVTTQQVPDADIGLCAAAESPVRVSDDRDDDRVPDASDSCRDVAGAAPTGCPTVTRAVSASYGDGSLTGEVSVTALGGAPVGACSSGARLQVWRVDPGGTREPLGEPTTPIAGGAYSIDVALAPGTTVLVSALAGQDPGRALCGAADSAEVVAFGDRDDDSVPDADDDCPDVVGVTGSAGCPVVRREVVTASYAVGKVSGTVRPVDPSVAPAGACTGAPVAVTWTGNDGSQVRRAGSVGAGGDFELEVGRPPVGTGLTVTFDDFDHELVAICPAVQPSMSVTVESDRDDDGVPDAADGCVDVHGPSRDGDRTAGCPVIDRRITASYADGRLTGRVELVDPAASPPGACSRGSSIEVYSLVGSSWDALLGEGSSATDGSFAIPVGRLVDGTVYYAFEGGYLDPAAGLCRTAEVQATFLDRDGDSFGDVEDRCLEVEGPPVGAPDFSEAFRGCQLVDSSVSAAYADGAVTGRLSVSSPPDAPAGACQAAAQVRVVELVGDLDGPELGRGETSVATGTYSVDVGDLPGGTRMRVLTNFPELVVHGISACAAGHSEVVEVPDADGDTVADDADECPSSAGPERAERPGCPTLTRSVTAQFTGQAVSGQLAVTGSGNAPAGACLATAVELYRRGAGGSEVLVGSAQADATGRFSLVPSGQFATADSHIVLAPPAFDRGVAMCAEARSEPVAVDLPDGDGDVDGDGVVDRDDECVGVPGGVAGSQPGCPTLSRTVTASYAAGAVTGQVTVTNPGDAPAGACTPGTVEIYRLGAGGAQALAGSATTAPDGGYHVVLADALLPGTSYVARAPGFVDLGRATCAAAESPTGGLPVPPPPGSGGGGGGSGADGGGDGDADGVPDALDRCATVAGSPGGRYPGCPTFSRTIKASYRNGVLKGRVSSRQTVPGTTVHPCAAAPKLTVWVIKPGGKLRSKVGAGATSAKGTFSIRLARVPAEGTRLRVKAKANLARGLASCAAGFSRVLRATS